MSEDFLDEMVAEETARDPGFPALLDEAIRRREFARRLAAERQAAGRTQVEIAEVLGTSQSQVARIEGGGTDVKLSTLLRFAAVLGFDLELGLKKHTATPRRRQAALTSAGRAHR